MRTSVLKISFYILLLVAATLFIAAYFLIPSQIDVSIAAKIGCNRNAASRIINNQWDEVLNKNLNSNNATNGYSYTVSKQLYSAANIRVNNGNADYSTDLVLLPLNHDSTLLKWSTTIRQGNNPIQKLIAYYNAYTLKQNMTEVTQQLRRFLESTQSVYHYNITHTTLTDTVLISTKILCNVYPSTAQIYALVQGLRQYINEQDAYATNYPMLNVTKTDSGFITMVGIPTSRQLPAKGNFYPKRLIPYPDKILTTQVIGGTSSILNAYRQIELYMLDHSLEAPVIPFEQMITDRSKERDTSKWVTKIFYPIV